MTTADDLDKLVPVNPSWLDQIFKHQGLPQDKKPDELTDDQRIDLFIALDRARKDAEVLAGLYKNAAAEMEERLAEYYVNQGLQKQTRNGATLSLRNERWPAFPESIYEGLAKDDKEGRKAAREVAKQKLIEAMTSSDDTAFLVSPNFNWQTLRSFCLNDLEVDALDNPVIPDHLEGVLAITTTPRMRVTKG